MLRIGSFQTDCRVLLAPIAGCTDLAFRLAMRSAGHRGLAYTELLHSRGILEGNRDAQHHATVSEADRPFGVQLYGNDADWFCAAAQWAQRLGADVLDVNMGCPVDKVTKTNGGSMLLCDPDRTTRMVERIVKSVRLPVTCKLRLGWNRQALTAPRLAHQLEQAGVQLITIHGRTTGQRFKGCVDLDGIASVVAAAKSIPVIGNGDIKSAADAGRMMDLTGCAGVMVARGAIKNPFLLRAIDSYLNTGVVPDESTVVEKIEFIRTHFELMRQFRGDRMARIVMRGRIASYAKTMGHVKPMKEAIRLMEKAADLHRALDDVLAVVEPGWTRVPHWVFYRSHGVDDATEVLQGRETQSGNDAGRLSESAA